MKGEPEMNKVKNQQGYALLLVLLMIVMFLGISATFMAGSLSNAKQEQTVDTSNKAVAAAEMGVTYYTSDFEREINFIKKELSDKTIELLGCFKSSASDPATNVPCYTIAEINSMMKEQYRNRVLAKIDNLRTVDHTKTAVSVNGLNYWLAEEEIAPPIVSDTMIEVTLEVKGESGNTVQDLSATFEFDIPETFLQQHEELEYDYIFNSTPAEPNCSVLLNDIKEKAAQKPYECSLGAGSGTLSLFLSEINQAGLNPEDFRVYTDDFGAHVCDGSNCNNLTLQGITVVANAGDTAIGQNMNNLTNLRLIVNGLLETGNNMNNLGKQGEEQTIIVKELVIGNNLELENFTNLLVLGYKGATGARLEFANNFRLRDNSKLCIDVDRVDYSNLTAAKSKVTFNDSSTLVYYTSNPDQTVNLTGSHVVKMTNYKAFLKHCGIDTENIEIPLTTGFDFEVEY